MMQHEADVELNKNSGIWGRVIFPGEFYLMVQMAILGFAESLQVESD